MSASPKDVSKTKNANEIWKELDAIFQAQIRHYVLCNDKDKFNAVTQEFGFNDIQKQFLFDAIQTFTAQFTPVNINNNISNKSSEKKSLYAIPTNKNEKIPGAKCERNNIENNDLFSDGTDSDNEPSEKKCIKKKTKKRKKVKMQNILESDLTSKKKEELEEENIYIVDEIVGHREIGNHKYKYNVKWYWYNEKTWEPPENLMSNTIKNYWKSKGYKMDEYGRPYLIVKKKNKEHNNNKIFTCNECNKIFKNGFALGGHKAAKHSKKQKKKQKRPKQDEQNTSVVSDCFSMVENEE